MKVKQAVSGGGPGRTSTILELNTVLGVTWIYNQNASPLGWDDTSFRMHVLKTNHTHHGRDNQQCPWYTTKTISTTIQAAKPTEIRALTLNGGGISFVSVTALLRGLRWIAVQSDKSAVLMYKKQRASQNHNNWTGKNVPDGFVCQTQSFGWYLHESNVFKSWHGFVGAASFRPGLGIHSPEHITHKNVKSTKEGQDENNTRQ